MRFAGPVRAELNILGSVRILAEFSPPGFVAAGRDPSSEHDVLRLPIPLREDLLPEELVGKAVEGLGIASFREHLRDRHPFVAQGDHALFGTELLAVHFQDSPERAVEIHRDVAQLETCREGGLAVDRKRTIGVAILPGQVVLGLEPCNVPFDGKTARFGLELRLADGLAVGVQHCQVEWVGERDVGRRAEGESLVPFDLDFGNPVRAGPACLRVERERAERYRAKQWKLFHARVLFEGFGQFCRQRFATEAARHDDALGVDQKVVRDGVDRIDLRGHALPELQVGEMDPRHLPFENGL